MGGSTQPWVWIPALVFGNLFALYWLLRVFLVANPAQRLRLWSWARPAQSDPAKPSSPPTTPTTTDKGPTSGPHTAHAVIHVTPVVHASSTIAALPSPSTASCLADSVPPDPQPEAIRRASRTLVEPMFLQWKDIGCSYKGSSGPHVVLSGVTGCARPGSLHALLGPSGAGKSSLLDILAQRKQLGELTGQVLLNGRKVSSKALVRRSAYVPQDDNFMPILTASETLGFYASLLLPAALSKRAKAARTQEVLTVLGLAKCHDTLVGGQLPGGMCMRGLSGGERKRLALGVGLLAAPSLLFLDEPTSGLDSYAALTVMRYIRAMATEAHHVVIASIHQPRSAIWSMFDEVTVLSHGLMMFSGPCGDMVPWFTQRLTHALTLDETLETHAAIGASSNSDGDQDSAQGDGCGVAAGCLGRFKERRANYNIRPTDHVIDVDETHTPWTAAGTGARHIGDNQGAPPRQQGVRVTTGATAAAGADGAVLPVVVYRPEVHGVPSDWVLDVVSVGFGHEAPDTEHQDTLQVYQLDAPKPLAPSGQTSFFHSMDQLKTAAAAFRRHQQAQGTALLGRAPGVPLFNTHPASPPDVAAHVELKALPAEVLPEKPLQQAKAVARANTVTLVARAGVVGTHPTWSPLAASVAKDYHRTASASPSVIPITPRRHTISTGTAASTADSTRVGAVAAGGSSSDGSGSDDEAHEAFLAQQMAAMYDPPPVPQSTTPTITTTANTTMADSSAVAPVLVQPPRLPSIPEAGRLAASSSGGGSGESETPSTCFGTAEQRQQALSHLEIVLAATQARERRSKVGGCLPAAVQGRLHRTWVHMRALLWREVMAITRNPADVAGRMLTFAWIAVFAGLVFYNLPNELGGVQMRLNVHFANTAFVLLMPYTSMSLYTADRRLWLADQSSRLYSPSCYYLAKVVATLPFHVVCSVAYALIVIGMTGLRHGVMPAVETVTITSLMSLIAVQVLHCASTLAKNQDIAFMIGLLWTALNLLLSGFFITYRQFAFQWLSQLRYLSAQSYAFEGLALGELQGVVYSCSQGLGGREMASLLSFLPQLATPQASVFTSVLRNPGPKCQAHADAILQYFDLTRDFNATVAILLSYLAVMHLFTYLALMLASRQEKR